MCVCAHVCVLAHVRLSLSLSLYLSIYLYLYLSLSVHIGPASISRAQKIFVYFFILGCMGDSATHHGPASIRSADFGVLCALCNMVFH